MSIREFTREEQAHFLGWALGYAVGLVVLVGLVLVTVLRDTNPVLTCASVGLLVSVFTLALRHLFRAVSPFEPVEVPVRRWP